DLDNPVTFTWVVDTTAPQATVTLVQPHASVTQDTSLQAEVSGEDVVAYMARLNGEGWSDERPVATPIAAEDLQEGGHVVEVIGRDTAGNWQAVSAATEVTW